MIKSHRRRYSSNTTIGLASSYLSTVLLAGTGIFAKSMSIPSTDMTLYRSWVATLIIIVGLSITRSHIFLKTLRDYLIVIVLGILLGIHWITFFAAMKVATVAIGMTALYTYPVITVFLEAIASRRPIEKEDAICSGCALIGVYFMTPIGLDIGNAMLGVGLGVFSAFCFSLRNVAQKKYLYRYNSLQIMLFQVMTISIVLIPFINTEPFVVYRESGGSLILLGIFFTAAPHTLMAVALQRLQATTVAFIGCLQPAIGAILAALVLKEFHSINVIVGGTLILGCAVFTTRMTVARRE